MDSDQRAVLRDGSEVLIRPIRGTDAPALRPGSPGSVPGPATCGS